MIAKVLASLVFVGLLAADLTTLVWAEKMPTDLLSGKPPAGSKLSVQDGGYQVKYHCAFEVVLWPNPAMDIYGCYRAATL